MSGTLGVTRQRVRLLLRDLDRGNYAFKTPEVDAEINGALTAMAARLRLGEQWSAGAVSLVPGTASYTLSGSQQYGSVVKARLASVGWEVPLVTRTQFDEYREGQTAASPQTGQVQVATLYENPSQATIIEVWPTPVAADSLDLFYTLFPAALTADSSVIPFGALGLEALAHEVAARLASKSTPEVLAQLVLAPNAGQVFSIQAERLSHDARVRREKQEGAGHVRRGGRGW